eukprot:3041726-Karenia_brevis.AAC.1
MTTAMMMNMMMMTMMTMMTRHLCLDPDWLSGLQNRLARVPKWRVLGPSWFQVGESWTQVEVS